MELNRLRYFCVVAETGNITRAAAMLHLTPTALSKAIKVLEREVGTQLLAPEGRGIRVTDNGRELARRAAPLLAEVLALPDQINRSHREVHWVRIASHEVFATYFTTVLGKQLPDHSFELRYFVPGDIERALLDGHVDLGITYLPVPTADVDHIEAGQVTMGIYGRAEWNGKPFDELPFAAPARPLVGSPTRAHGLDGWPDDRIHRHIRHKVTNTETALEFCRQGRAVAYFPNFVVDLHNAVTASRYRLHRLPDPPELRAEPQPVFVARRTGDVDNPDLEGVLAAVDGISD